MELVLITPEQVKMMLSDEELFSRVSEDGIEYQNYSPLLNRSYLGMFMNDALIGFWIIEGDNSTTINIHCNILKRYRKHSLEVGMYFRDYIFDKYKSLQKLNCKIPVTYPDVYEFTKKFGFKDEGVDRKSIMKGGQLVDRYNLGLTREDI